MTAAYLEISAWLILYVLLLPKNVLLLPRPEACNFIKKRLKQTKVFSSEIFKIFRNTYFEDYLWMAASESTL